MQRRRLQRSNAPRYATDAHAGPRTRPRKGSIRTRLLIATALWMLLLGLAVSAGSVLVALNSGRRQVVDQLTAVVTLKAAEIKTWVRGLQAEMHFLVHHQGLAPDLEVVATLPQEHPAYAPARAEVLLALRRALIAEPSFEELFVLDRQGIVVLSTSATAQGENRRLYPYFEAGLTESGIVVQTLSLSGAAADLNSIVAFEPIVDASGETLGILAGRVRPDTLNALMQERSGLGDTGETYLVGENSVLLTESRFPGYRAGQLFVRSEAVDAALRQHQDGAGSYRGYRDTQVVGVHRWLPDLNVALIGEQERREALRPVFLTAGLNVAVIAVGICVTALLSLTMTRKITAPLTELADTAARIAAGDLEIVAAVHRDDEIGALARAFNDMTTRLRTMLGQEAERAQALEREISERQRAEIDRTQLLMRLRAHAQQLTQVIDAVPEGVLLLNHFGQVVRANRLGQRDLTRLADANIGDTIHTLAGRPLSELLKPPPKGLWHDIRYAGRSLQVLAQPFETDATPTGSVMVIRDVTHQREAEQRIQQQERLAAVGQLAAGIAHDFNNIMAVVSLYAQLTARSSDLSARDRERLEVINAQALQATELIQQILDFSRRTMLERAPLYLVPLLKEQVKLLQRTFPENVTVTLDGELEPCYVYADATRIQQMVMNLALNARDAMPEGGEVRITLDRFTLEPGAPPPAAEMRPGEYVRLTFTDTGTGIPAEALPHIFEPFYTTKPRGQGSGLGLPQVHGIVGAHEGAIAIATEMGRGTTITVFLPALDHAEAHAPESGDACRQAVPRNGNGESILVVEDNPGVRAAIVEGLTHLAYTVVEARHGLEALAYLDAASAPVDLIVSDIVMPHLGGVGLVERLQEQGRKVPVILITGHPLDEERKHGSQHLSLVVSWLTKPIDIDHLAALIRTTLDNHRSTV